MIRRSSKAVALIAEPASGAIPQLKAWALVELFGHQRIVGHCTSEAFGSSVMLRVDVPDLLKDNRVVRPGFTRYFGMGAIYSVTPVDEASVRSLLPSIDGMPERPLSLMSEKLYGDED